MIFYRNHQKKINNFFIFLMAVVITLIFSYGFPFLYYLNNQEKIETKRSFKKDLVIVQEKPKPKKEKKKKMRVTQKTIEKSRLNRSAAKFKLKLGGSSSGVGIGSGDIQNIVFKEGEVDKPAKLISSVQATYPSLAGESGLSGEVELLIVIDENGDVIKSEVIKEDPEGYGFKDACLSVIYQFKFRPAIKENIPVKMEYIYPFSF